MTVNGIENVESVENIVKSPKSPVAVADLQTAFQSRDTFYAHRSSALFPVFLRKFTDVHIVFLNYWTLKNNIPADKIAIVLCVYSSDGQLTKRLTITSLNFHNQLSIREMLDIGPIGTDVRFDGSVNVEIISTYNLRFSFPAIVAIYQSGTLFSSVHSAGRIKNSDENQSVRYTHETNWNCKFTDGITPFFHFFNGTAKPRKPEIRVTLRSGNGTAKLSVDLSIENIPEFGSKFFWVKEIFTSSNFEIDDFVSVEMEHNSIFPRLVVGNLHIQSNFLEVTHSFPIIEEVDHCQPDASFEFESMLCAITNNELELSLKVFPTNCTGSYSSKIFSQKFNQHRLFVVDEQNPDLNDSISGGMFTLKADEQFHCIRMTGELVPARFNSSFVYRVKGVVSSLSTDIARGAQASVVPPKWHHWGHAYLGDGYLSSLLIRNNSHNPDETRDAVGKLRIFAADFECEKLISVNAESSLSLSISDLFPKIKFTAHRHNARFVSWFLEFDRPTCDTFWVAYRKSDGAIFGEHGF